MNKIILFALILGMTRLSLCQPLENPCLAWSEISEKYYTDIQSGTNTSTARTAYTSIIVERREELYRLTNEEVVIDTTTFISLIRLKEPILNLSSGNDQTNLSFIVHLLQKIESQQHNISTTREMVERELQLDIVIVLLENPNLQIDAKRRLIPLVDNIVKCNETIVQKETDITNEAKNRWAEKIKKIKKLQKSAMI